MKRCGLAGKGSITAAELYDHGAQGSEPSRAERGGGDLLKNSLIIFEHIGNVPSQLALRFAGLARRLAGLVHSPLDHG
eukprot:6213586-Pleurochrysis_carterae.AAC.2